MRTPLIAGNWKMNGTLAGATALARGVAAGVAEIADAQFLVCPPYVFLEAVARALADTTVGLGAQNVSERDAGAYTGEVAGAMLREVGCSMVIIGHSERRHIFGETSALVAEKFDAARRAGLTPIVCLGETLEEREAGRTEAVVAAQLDTVLDLNAMEAVDGAVLAYEPVWAIGTGRTATPEQAQGVHAYVRERLGQRDRGVAERIRILYGGSVKASNAAGLFEQPDIDGALVGGASLDVEAFLAICRAAAGS